MANDDAPNEVEMLCRDNHRMRVAGCKLAEAALYVAREHDGVHRLMLAVSEWAKAIANEGDRHRLDTQPLENGRQ